MQTEHLTLWKMGCREELLTYNTAELAQAIDEIFADPGKLRRMQEASYIRAQQFAIPVVAEGFYEALDATDIPK